MKEVSQASDPFAVFGLPAKYALDKAQLRAKYVALQKQLHPDVSRDPDAEQKIAAVNLAYRSLNDDVLRANALCRGKCDIAPEYYPEQISVGERRQALEASGDAEKLAELQRELEQKLKESTQLFDGMASGRRMKRARMLLGQMNFYAQQLQQIKDSVLRLKKLSD